MESILKKIDQKEFRVGIIGLGYVGLPLMWTFNQNGIPTLGFEIDENKVSHLKSGTPYIKHLGKEMMKKLSESAICDYTTDFSRISEADALLMCIPTPLDHHREPDLSFVINTSETIGTYMRRGQLIVLESTTYPMTTDEVIIPILEERSGLKCDEDFYVAYSPEREDPGNKDFNTSKIPKVLGASSDAALKIAQKMYETSIERIIPVSDCKTAEAVKLTENIFRSVNIALVNELKIIYEAMNIDVHEVLDAAGTKPFGFMKFTPGPGLGGHCIPIDPFYLTWKAREFDQNTRFIELAGEINTGMPYYVIDKTIEALNTHKKALNGSRILVIGLAYKPDVDDMRESPTFKILDLLKAKGAQVAYYDNYIPEIPTSREHQEWTRTKSVSWQEDIISKFDAVVISTNHSDINYTELGNWCNCIIDTRNAMKDYQSNKTNHIFKA
ncbi:MAG: nucleotide sugar dehydrogenase [Balneola sp.]|nr:nucleotide sugar dehydrogenase [Balneola sp.]